jgi:paraquat-inducible protein A
MTIACPDCGTLETLPPLPRGSTAVCVACRGQLEKTSGRSMAAALAFSSATLLLLVPLNVLPLIRVDIFRMHSENVIGAGVAQLWAHGWILLAGLSAVLVIVVPFVRFGALTLVLASLRLGRRPRWLGRAFRWAVWLDPWAMLDVFLLAACVGYFRLTYLNEAQISIQLGGKCFIAAALLTMLARAALDRRSVWRAIGGETDADPHSNAIGCTICDLVQPASRVGHPCPRCGARLKERKTRAMSRTTALLVTSFILLLPSNLYPMNVSQQLGTRLGYTIFTGITDLFKTGLWPLGVVVFCTSILIPALKILAVGWCVLSVWRRSDRHLVAKTEAFRLVAESGRWSKTDPFTIVFFVPLVNFGPLGSASAGWGATAFVLMTFLTMAASVTFDPRLMWDAARATPA